MPLKRRTVTRKTQATAEPQEVEQQEEQQPVVTTTNSKRLKKRSVVINKQLISEQQVLKSEIVEAKKQIRLLLTSIRSKEKVLYGKPRTTTKLVTATTTTIGVGRRSTRGVNKVLGKKKSTPACSSLTANSLKFNIVKAIFEDNSVATSRQKLKKILLSERPTMRDGDFKRVMDLCLKEGLIHQHHIHKMSFKLPNKKSKEQLDFFQKNPQLI